jgi:O-antigen/teichoic acid export membrane protein
MSARRGPRPRTSRRQGPDSIAKNTAASLASQFTTASLTALLTVFLVRALGTKEYGLFALTMGVGAVTLAFADLGISLSTARFVAEHRGRDTELRALVADALKLKIVVTGLVCALLAALSSVIASIYRDPGLVWPLRVMALATFGQSTYLMVLGVSTARGRMVVNVRLVAAESLLEVSASIALVLAGAGAVGAVLGRAIGYVLGGTIAALVVLRLTGDGSMRFTSLPRRATVRRISGYARAVFAIDASYTVTASLSVLILGAYAGSAASGIYQAPVKLITLIMYVGLSVSNGVGPRLARSPGREPDVAALQRGLRAMIGFQCLVLAPTIVWAKPITRLLLGPGYARSADVLVALAPYIFFSGLAPLVTTSVNYMGEAQRRIPISLATLCVAAAAGFLLIPRHGVIGAAIATDIAFGFYTLAHIWLCRRLLPLRLESLVWSLSCGLAAAAAMGIVLASVGTEHLRSGDWVIGAVGGVGAFVSMLIFTREIRGVDIARAATVVGGLVGRGDRARLEPSPEPPMLPRHTGAAAPRRIAASVTHDTTPARVATPAGGELRAAPAVALDGRSPAAMPPAWAEGWMHEPVALGHAIAAPGSQARHPPDSAPAVYRAEAMTSGAGPAGPSLDDDGPAPASQPPAWLSNLASSGRGAGNGGPDEDKISHQPQASASSAGAAPGWGSAAAAPGWGSAALMYQIAWRLQSDTGVFELRPAELSRTSEATSGEAPVSEQSVPVPWSWRMPPAPTPEARRAHDALVDRLVSGGWRRAGVGDAWFAHRFRSPAGQHHADA